MAPLLAVSVHALAALSWSPAYGKTAPLSFAALTPLAPLPAIDWLYTGPRHLTGNPWPRIIHLTAAQMGRSQWPPTIQLLRWLGGPSLLVAPKAHPSLALLTAAKALCMGCG
ncbi:hypothetical protein GOP47_0026164 [Adiantum capillus-veneris]|uniref:Secreted protein n=1 Tax=Adiantum capillus-veneris TaxID=13818 RepID=A0A9D4Z3H8_ADICA|nr:hypothetical protein GOP47_0026164 [Adiantum capillus-veneris]